jgi:D-glycero-alpha-D-manno-heptose-7-phosphate kinase
MRNWQHIRVTSSAPVRICDLGGWSDTWFAEHGTIWSIAVTPRVEVEIDARRGPSVTPLVRLHAVNFATWLTLPDDAQQHPLLAAAVAEIPPPPACATTITLHADMPPGGSTGTSAAVSVALLAALQGLQGTIGTAAELARMAHRLETDRLHMQSGIQDQIAAAYGGINHIEMTHYPHATVHALPLDDETLHTLESRLLLFYLGKPHQSSAIHEHVIQRLHAHNTVQQSLEPLRLAARQASDAVRSHDWHLLGRLMQANTEAQRALHPMLVSPVADDIIRIAQRHGVLGWKVNGAGGDGGSLTLLCNDSSVARRQLITDVVATLHEVRHIPIHISRTGVNCHTEILA